MALTPCSACHRRILAKPFSIYTARFVEQQRVAYRVSLCHGCAEEYAETVKAAKPMRVDDAASEWPETCPLCGSGTGEDLDPIYLTVYEPKREGISLVVPSCGTCTANLAPMLERYGRRLADRQASTVNGVSPAHASGEGAPSPLAWA